MQEERAEVLLTADELCELADVGDFSIGHDWARRLPISHATDWAELSYHVQLNGCYRKYRREWRRGDICLARFTRSMNASRGHCARARATADPAQAGQSPGGPCRPRRFAGARLLAHVARHSLPAFAFGGTGEALCLHPKKK